MSEATTTGLAVISGASGGLGEPYADQLARRGHDLLLVGRRQDRLDTLAARVAKETGVNAEVLVADLTVESDLRALEERLRTDQRIEVLVNNAGVGGLTPLVKADLAEVTTLLQLNVTALTRLTGAVLGSLVERGTGTIINPSSALAVNLLPSGSAYSGTKSYVLTFTQGLHQEVAGTGVRVQAVMFGAVRTAIWDGSWVPLSSLPEEIVMEPAEAVEAALAGLDAGELVTVPSLPDVADWDAFEAARLKLAENVSRRHAAERFAVAGRG
ncbi:SDR family NAD(P)-dependent oxidoreductase [Actinopolymorpha pittospori]|uniref:Short-subunit dehydrogenase n=1 Tax=Actinopolymorpha pittospori TaxID=648752 RepID=A0A927NB26_9ACTN|nr:SDR family oxidoreductase [Actinopolymorpha pittospori]MBE1612237.1 short-subunit dehydrogenase [Actinopolymorpha pittospori]